MPTTDLTESEIRGYITALQRSLGTDAEVTVVEFSDGRRVEKQVKSTEDKLAALGYLESLLAQVVAGSSRPRRLILAPTSGVEC